ncbi:MAG: hypothetical protein ACRDWE_06495 [Acidimicrobiales bacterium]
MTGRPGRAAPGACSAQVAADRVRVRRGVVAGMVAVAVAAGVLASCASARSELGTADSNCYVDVAAALHAVHHEGRLHGVRLVSVASLERRAPLLYLAAHRAARHSTQVCLVAFQGAFTAARVASATGDPSGDFAVVELGYPDRRLLATLLVPTAPLPFGHPHL